MSSLRRSQILDFLKKEEEVIESFELIEKMEIFNNKMSLFSLLVEVSSFISHQLQIFMVSRSSFESILWGEGEKKERTKFYRFLTILKDGYKKFGNESFYELMMTVHKMMDLILDFILFYDDNKEGVFDLFSELVVLLSQHENFFQILIINDQMDKYIKVLSFKQWNHLFFKYINNEIFATKSSILLTFFKSKMTFCLFLTFLIAGISITDNDNEICRKSIENLEVSFEIAEKIQPVDINSQLFSEVTFLKLLKKYII